ncbi:hypothetical protein D3C85_1387990 [compost metagenome]
MKQNGNNGGIHAAAKCAKHLFIANFCTKLFNHIFHERGHRPIADTTTHFINEVVNHFVPLNGVTNLGVELYRMDFAITVAHCSNRKRFRACFNDKAIRKSRNMVTMAHPYGLLCFKTFNKRAFIGEKQIRFPIFTCMRTFNFSVQLVGNQLHPVANT